MNYQLEKIKYLPIFYIIVLTYEDILDIIFFESKKLEGDFLNIFKALKRYDEHGFNSKGFHKNGTKYDEYGFGKRGMHRNGTYYNEEGYDREGYDKKGYDRNGFNSAGFDKEGYNKNGYNILGYDRCGEYLEVRYKWKWFE